MLLMNWGGLHGTWESACMLLMYLGGLIAWQGGLGQGI